ncbi:hypothetical protein [Alicyclobacillus fastidiosus]|uniref:Uncharacterized protein n=1 Tax=Alicyclobacillus fastidiosus TaxID=392011 RepID=A0ABV5AJV3_9BACL|nr:hypothetical protein [Alicyclobacillus fastidiosus]WEH08345.1 hypothetical protein PYS47_16815 [Alicyclobacillus fastidiosus]
MRLKTVLMSSMMTLGAVGTMTAYGATVVPTGNMPDTGQTVVKGTTNSTAAGDTADGKLSKGRHGHRHGGFIRDTAKILNMQPSELREELKSGKSIVQVAASKGISEQVLTSKLRANLEARLKKSEQKGKLTADKANKILTNFDRHISEKLNRKGHAGKASSSQKAS